MLKIWIPGPTPDTLIPKSLGKGTRNPLRDRSYRVGETLSGKIKRL